MTVIGGPKPGFSHLQQRKGLLPDNEVGRRGLPKLGRFHEILHSETFLGDRLGLAQSLSQGGLNGWDETQVTRGHRAPVISRRAHDWLLQRSGHDCILTAGLSPKLVMENL